MSDIKEIRELIESVKKLTEAPSPEDWELQRDWAEVELAINLFSRKVKRFEINLEKGHYSDEIKSHWSVGLSYTAEIIAAARETGLLDE